MLSEAQRRLLGQFVRAHRERLGQEGVTGRRRTPGLRREELAARAGISATWCAWIEQGRAVQASPEALARLAAALRLSRAERAYLFELAGRRDPDMVAAASPIEDPPASLAGIVASLKDPAYGLDPLWNACCWNRHAARLFQGWLTAGAQRNLLRYVFLDPVARRLIPEWEERARRVLAEFRADFGGRFDDPRTRSLVEALSRESAFFAAAWREQDVLEREGGLRLFAHPSDGLLRFQQFTYRPSDRLDYKLVVLRPEIAGMSERLTTG